MAGWHHRLDGHEFEQALGAGDGQGSLAAAVHGVAKNRLTVGTILEGRIEWAESKVTLSYSIRWDCVRSPETLR